MKSNECACERSRSAFHPGPEMLLQGARVLNWAGWGPTGPAAVQSELEFKMQDPTETFAGSKKTPYSILNPRADWSPIKPIGVESA